MEDGSGSLTRHRFGIILESVWSGGTVQALRARIAAGPPVISVANGT